MSHVYRPPPEPSKKEKAKRFMTNLAMGFGMGMFVGSAVVLIHTVITPFPKGVSRWTGFGKRAMGTGASFGCIFAVGALIR